MRTKQKQSTSLADLIPAYGQTKAQADEYAKVAKKQNSDIKKLMSALLKDDDVEATQEADGWVATYQVRISESYNEDALLEFAHKHKALQSCVETKEVFNAQKLEDLIYAGEVPKKVLLELDKFREQKRTEYLYIKQKEG